MFIHANERPYACTECDKRFNRPSCLREHNRIHTNVRPYACTKCDRRFNRPSCFKKHKCIHKQPYACTHKKCKESSDVVHECDTSVSEGQYVCTDWVHVCTECIELFQNRLVILHTEQSWSITSCLFNIQSIIIISCIFLHVCES